MSKGDISLSRTAFARTHFFVTSLPRSRTAWLANWLTWRDSFCYHDGLYGCADYAAFATKLRDTQAANVGNSDPANLLVWRRLVHDFPDAHWVVVKRNFDDALCSSQRAFGAFDERVLEHWAVELDELVKTLDPLVVGFDDLSAHAFEIARHCGVNGIPPARLRLLSGMQVQIEPRLLKQGIRELLAQPPMELLRDMEVAA